jgi:hypothetical protein
MKRDRRSEGSTATLRRGMNLYALSTEQFWAVVAPSKETTMKLCSNLVRGRSGTFT